MLTASTLVAQLAAAPDAPPFFLFVRYRPQSGAARRAIAGGADPVPLLTDIQRYGGMATVAVEDVAGFLAMPEAPEEVTALCSPLPGTGRQRLLLDFSAPISDRNEDELCRYVRHCGWKGWLLVSGASYHFIGRDPMPLNAWRRAMARALLIPGIDHRFMGHALHNEEGAVRLTTCPVKPHTPYVIAVLD